MVTDHLEENKFKIIKENVMFKRYIRISDRRVEFPDGRQIDWDVVSHSTAAVIVVPFFTKTKTIHLLSEYAQGLNEMTYCFASGGFDPAKHSSLDEAAKCELSEEARLKGGTLIPLLPPGSPGVAEVKWSSNRFYPFLVIDPEIDTEPKQRDAEEFIELVPDQSIDSIEHKIFNGEMILASAQSYWMAKNYLQLNNLI